MLVRKCHDYAGDALNTRKYPTRIASCASFVLEVPGTPAADGGLDGLVLMVCSWFAQASVRNPYSPAVGAQIPVQCGGESAHQEHLRAASPVPVLRPSVATSRIVPALARIRGPHRTRVPSFLRRVSGISHTTVLTRLFSHDCSHTTVLTRLCASPPRLTEKGFSPCGVSARARMSIRPHTSRLHTSHHYETLGHVRDFPASRGPPPLRLRLRLMPSGRRGRSDHQRDAHPRRQRYEVGRHGGQPRC